MHLANKNTQLVVELTLPAFAIKSVIVAVDSSASVSLEFDSHSHKQKGVTEILMGYVLAIVAVAHSSDHAVCNPNRRVSHTSSDSGSSP